MKRREWTWQKIPPAFQKRFHLNNCFIAFSELKNRIRMKNSFHTHSHKKWKLFIKTFQQEKHRDYNNIQQKIVKNFILSVSLETRQVTSICLKQCKIKSHKESFFCLRFLFPFHSFLCVLYEQFCRNEELVKML